MLAIVQKYCSNFKGLCEAPILDKNKQIIGWHSVAHLETGEPLGGGAGIDRSSARKIAIAELMERKLVENISKCSQKKLFLLDEHPSTSGFAFGYKKKQTKLRSMAEAIERWIWSKWIDEFCYIPSINIHPNNLTKIAQVYKNSFDQVLFFEKNLEIATENENENEKSKSFKIGIVIGIKGDGVFPGSRVTYPQFDTWEHALLEAYRHLKIFENPNANNFRVNDIIYDRIKFFGKNKQLALNCIKRNSKIKWPTPTVKLLREFNLEEENIYLWRTILSNFIPWNEGPIDRFIY